MAAGDGSLRSQVDDEDLGAGLARAVGERNFTGTQYVDTIRGDLGERLRRLGFE